MAIKVWRNVALWASVGLVAWIVITPLARSQSVYQMLGYQQIAGMTSATPLTIPLGAPRWALMCVEIAGVRYRDDGSAPTSSIGQPILAGQCVAYSGPMGSFQAIQQTSGAVLNVSYYR